MNIFQFDEDYFSNEENKSSLAKMNFWYWMLQQQTKGGFYLLPPFINYICNTRDEQSMELILEDEENDDDGDGVIY